MRADHRRIAHALHRLSWLALLACLLAACQAFGGSPQPIPTATPTRAPATPAPVGPVPDRASPAPLATERPALVLPGASGITVACPSNALRLPLVVNGEPVGAASRIAATGDDLYLLLDGGLYRVPRLSADAAAPDPQPVLVPGDGVAGRPVQELVDIAPMDGGATVLALDKAGHLYAFHPAEGTAALLYRATPDPDADLSSQFVALTADGQGRPVLLDTAFGVLWTPAAQQALDPLGESLALTDGVDVASADGRLYVLRADGSIVSVTQSVGSRGWQVDEERRLGLSIFVSDHLGVDLVFVVDALRRTITGLLPADASPVVRYAFGFTDMGLLRDAVFAGGRLYAVADGDLYVFPGPANGPTTCPPPAPGSYARPSLYGIDVLGVLRGWRFPIEGGSLPPWARLYPGATRIYRLGVHAGLDLYHWSGPDSFGLGYPVVAMGPGEVTRATWNYAELSEREFERLVAESVAQGQTSPEALERFSGRQVIIDHGGGVRTVYSHLDEIASGVVTGASVRASQPIGTVGLSGTQGEARPGASAPHLHAEIWIDERYLGQGITLAETMWWYAQIFEGY